MMSQEFRPGQVLTAELPGSFKAVRMPYRSGNFSAIAILPDNATAGPASLLPLLHGAKAPAASLFAPLPGGSGGALDTPVDVVALAGSSKGAAGGGAAWQPLGTGGLLVRLPKFKLRAHMSLSDPLKKKMGVVAAFSDTMANFSRVEGGPSKQQLYVSQVVQEVRAAGVASAATYPHVWSGVELS